MLARNGEGPAADCAANEPQSRETTTTLLNASPPVQPQRTTPWQRLGDLNASKNLQALILQPAGQS
jgi:hypothetical protein